jgi:hypothetical protein
MLAGRTNPALAGSGVGCGLAGRFATSWYTVGMRLAGRHLTCPTINHPADHLLSRVSPRYARTRVGSTDFAECGREPSCERRGSRGAVLSQAGAPLPWTSELML